MTEHKHLKRRVRERMAKTGERYAAARAQLVAQAQDDAGAPSSDAVARATGRDRDAWFALLDAHDATALTHTEIARWLREEHGVASWWSQSITVSYEHARGLRAVHETASGFQFAVSRTIALPAAALFAAVHDRLSREATGVRSATPPRIARYDLPEGRMLLTITPKDDARATVTLTHEKLPDGAAVERHKARWRAWLTELKGELERP